MYLKKAEEVIDVAVLEKMVVVYDDVFVLEGDIGEVCIGDVEDFEDGMRTAQVAQQVCRMTLMQSSWYMVLQTKLRMRM